MNASVAYDVFQLMHSACSRIYPIALDYVHNTEEDTVFKLPGTNLYKHKNRSGDYTNS